MTKPSKPDFGAVIAGACICIGAGVFVGALVNAVFDSLAMGIGGGIFAVGYLLCMGAHDNG